MSEQKKNYYKFIFEKRPDVKESKAECFEGLPETMEKICNLTDDQIALLKFLAKYSSCFFVSDWKPIKDITDFN